MTQAIDKPTPPPECNYRGETGLPLTYYCRHERVHTGGNIITAEICRVCSVRNIPCKNPRPENYLEQRGPPRLAMQAWNLAKAMASFVADGLTTVSQEEYSVRLAVCGTCERRVEDRCLECGCKLSWKARGRSFGCPISKWPDNSSAE